jgi:hypothetical protein
MRDIFTNVADAVSVFLSHTVATAPYRERLATHLSDSVRNFDLFLSQAQKSVPAFMPKSKMEASQTAIKTAATIFLRSRESVVELTRSIRKSGLDLALGSITESFDLIVSSLESIAPPVNPLSSFQSQPNKLIKDLIQQAQNLRTNVIRLFSSAEGIPADSPLVGELRAYSRQISSAFSNEFTPSSTEYENMRARAFAACNDVMQGLKSAVLFRNDMKVIFKEVDTFENLFEPYVEKFGVLAEKKAAAKLQPEIQVAPEPTFVDMGSYDEKMTPDELLEIGYEYLRKKLDNSVQVDRLFKLIRRKMTELDTKVGDLTKETKFLTTQLREFQQRQEIKDDLKEAYDAIHVFVHGVSAHDMGDRATEVDLAGKIKAIAGSLTHPACAKCAEYAEHEETARSLLRPYSQDSPDFLDVCESVNTYFVGLDTANQTALAEEQMNGAKLLYGYEVIMNELGIEDQTGKGTELDKILSRIQVIFQSVKDGEQKCITSLDNFEKDIARWLSEHLNVDSGQPVMQQLASLEKMVNDDKHMIANLQRLARETEERLATFLGITGNPKHTIFDSLKSLVNVLYSRNQPAPKILGRENDLPSVEARLHKLVATGDQSLGGIHCIIDELETMIEGLRRQERTRQVEFVKSRATIEMIAQRLWRALGTEPEDLKDVALDVVLERVAAMSEEVASRLGGEQPLSPSALNSLFEGVLSLIGASQPADPQNYIPDFCREFTILHESIEALKPFSATLTEIDEGLDVKGKPLGSGSPAVAFLRERLLRLQNSLNVVGPGKIHSLLFSVLSRFVTIMSLVLSSLPPGGEADVPVGPDDALDM